MPNQFLPSTKRVTNILAVVLLEELINVAGISMISLIIRINGSADIGKPKMVMITASATKPPPGMALMTIPTKKPTLMISSAFCSEVMLRLKRTNKKVVFKTPPTTDPSLCTLAPNGTTVSAISGLTPILFVYSRLAGIVAAEELVAMAVIAGTPILRKKTL